jgi:hypothetical protein
MKIHTLEQAVCEFWRAAYNYFPFAYCLLPFAIAFPAGDWLLAFFNSQLITIFSQDS